MADHEVTEEKLLKSVLESFIGSYAERDKSMAFSSWLADRLQKEIPDMPNETSEKLAGEIIEAVGAYDRTLDELKTAVDVGQSKKEWFAESLAKTYADMSLDAAGEKLRQIENAFLALNAQLMQEIDNTQTDEASVAETDYVEWNEYSVKNKAYEIGDQVILSGMAIAANVMKDKMQNSEAVDIRAIVQETLQDGLKKDSGEVKAMVAGAVKVAAEKGLRDILPEDTSIETVCDLAGAAVEGAEALFDAANGDCAPMEAMDRIGRAGVAAGCRFAGRVVEGELAKIPIIGPILVDLAGGLIDHMDSFEFAENVYKTAHDAAVATWKGIKESRIGRMVKGFVKLFN